MREENVGDDFPDWLTLLHVQLVLFAHLVSVIYEFVFVFENVKNIFFSSYFLISAFSGYKFQPFAFSNIIDLQTPGGQDIQER